MGGAEASANKGVPPQETEEGPMPPWGVIPSHVGIRLPLRANDSYIF
jgi:hypothetical protein